MYYISAFYKFTTFDDPDKLRPALREICAQFNIIGTILIAHEGINGTIAATHKEQGIDKVLNHIRRLSGCADMESKFSMAQKPPFKKMRIRLKREIVTMGHPEVKPDVKTGNYIEPQNWNALTQDRDVILIDTRNDYEIAIGSFAGALNPHIKKFGDFPRWWQENKNCFAGKKIAMFCTGGIRCEKSTNYLLSDGVKEVYHLKGGILKYLEEIPPEQSFWQGECYVFDERISVISGLKEGHYQICHACGKPLSPEDLKKESYEPGVQCHHCEHKYSPQDRARFRERQRQFDRTKTRTSGR